MKQAFLPREHGFWVMLSAVLLSALLRAPVGWRAGAGASLVLVAAVSGGGFLRRKIRKSETAQLVSAVALAFAGVPVELLAGATLSRAFEAAIVWVAVLLPSALVVRAAMARSSPRAARRARWLDAAAIGVALGAALVFAIAGRVMASSAAGLTAIVATALALARPGVKRLKRIGFGLAVLALVCALLLGA